MKQATKGDIPQLVGMMDEFYTEGGFQLNHQRAAEAFAGLLADNRFGNIWFIQAGAQDVGYIVVTTDFTEMKTNVFQKTDFILQ